MFYEISGIAFNIKNISQVRSAQSHCRQSNQVIAILDPALSEEDRLIVDKVE
ncbi:MAG: hypothetical protein SVY53_11905 [Chloroflexota bacterium]|nr:hypothetical protein [Chloroflexota bacterium]